MRLDSSEAVRAAVEERLNQGLSHSFWATLEGRGRINDVLGERELAQLDALDELVVEIGAILDHERHKRKPRIHREERVKLPREREKALKEILSVEAGRDLDVEHFRRTVLRGKLLPPGRCRTWVDREVRRQGRPSRTLHGPVDEDLDRPLVQGSEAEPLRYRDPTDDTAHAVWARGDSPLMHLKFVAREVTGRFGWNLPDAATFVLCGIAPKLFLGRAYVEPSVGPPSAAVRSIRLEVSPVLTPREVGKLYADMRAAAGDLENVPTRRDVSEKAGELAVLAAQVNDGRSWEEALRAWNERHPEWKRPREDRDVWLFARDARSAYERITGRRLRWKREPGARGHQKNVKRRSRKSGARSKRRARGADP